MVFTFRRFLWVPRFRPIIGFATTNFWEMAHFATVQTRFTLSRANPLMWVTSTTQTTPIVANPHFVDHDNFLSADHGLLYFYHSPLRAIAVSPSRLSVHRCFPWHELLSISSQDWGSVQVLYVQGKAMRFLEYFAAKFAVQDRRIDTRE